MRDHLGIHPFCFLVEIIIDHGVSIDIHILLRNLHFVVLDSNQIFNFPKTFQMIHELIPRWSHLLDLLIPGHQIIALLGMYLIIINIAQF